MTFPKSGSYLAHTLSLNTGNDETISIEFSNEGVVVTWFQIQSFIEAVNSIDSITTPEPLIARTPKGWITLNDGKLQKSSISTAGYSEVKFQYRRAVEAGLNEKDYSEVNGLASRIDGLAEWAEMWPTETRKVIQGRVWGFRGSVC